MTTLLHKKVISSIEKIKHNFPHALLVIGPNTLDNKVLSTDIAKLALDIKNIEKYQYIHNISLDLSKKNISIDQIRKIQQFLSLKVPGNKYIDRIVLINDADYLSLEAQNSLLKILEEPPKGSLIILNCQFDTNLLPTILSRLIKIYNIPPTKDQLKDHFKEVNNDDFNKAYAISGSNTKLLSDLLSKKDHELYKASELAKNILKSTIFERLLILDNLSKDKNKFLDIIYILERMAKYSISSKNNNSEKWQNILEQCINAKTAMKLNAQLKLTILNFLINL
ncbi:MAG TPA: hypothetical protein VLF63_00275 [Patescibacteria group bacterium]|nr:hypothetical protein [Patescibacteria group bacterium]